MSTVGKKNSGTVSLYWVTTADHSEDWFILAKSAGAAKRFHENYEGYNHGDAKARLILARAYLPRYKNG